VTKDKTGAITDTTGEGMTTCAKCGMPYAAGAKAAHEAKSTHRAAIAYAAAGDEGSDATGGTPADATAGEAGA
jgi:hypothetical protein